MNFIDENMDGNYDEEDDQEIMTYKRGTTLFTEEVEKEEETKNDSENDIFGNMNDTKAKDNVDFVKDTFAKFGLNMNLYNPSSTEIK